MFQKMFGRKGHSSTHAKSESPTHKPKKATLKQDKFVEGVIQHGNATKAARDAGYSPRSAAVIASRNLKRPDIQEQIKARIEAAKLDTDEIIGTLIGHMRADIGNLLGDDGSLDLVRGIENGSTHIIKKLVIRTRRIPGPTRATGRSLTVREGAAPDPANDLTEGEAGHYPIEETTYEIVLHDAQSAARHLARILHLEVKNRPIEARRPTDDELAHRMADLLERARANGRREGAAAQRPPMQTMESHSEHFSLAPATAPVSTTVRFQPEHNAVPSDKLRDRAKPTLQDPREILGKTPTGNGLWNRLFSSAQTLTFINRDPFPGNGPRARVWGLGSARIFDNLELCAGEIPAH
jgi:hypothetical protein